MVRVEATGFQAAVKAVTLGRDVLVVLSPVATRTEVTVTAVRGMAEEVTETPSIASVATGGALEHSKGPTIGNQLEGKPGILVQQTTTAQVSPFLRGFTGYQVLNLIDGVRFNNSTLRSGPNQYLAFLEPSQAERMEAVLGPTSSQYGSDALGGTIQVLTTPARFADGDQGEWHGQATLGGNSADLSTGATGRLLWGTARAALMGGAHWRDHQDLRGGGGRDSRHTLRRLFGLNDEQIRDITGNRMLDTAFRQSGGYAKGAFRPSGTQSLTAWYQYSTQENVRNYKDLWGGLGRLESAFPEQRLQFLYGRYEKLPVGWFDSVSGTASWNSQRDDTARQNLRFTDRRIADENGVDVGGLVGQAATHVGSRHVVLLGGEWYDERISSARTDFNPVTTVTLTPRPLYPDGSRYRTFGLFAQDSFDLLPERGRLKGSAGVRLTGIRYRTKAAPAVGVAESEQTFQDGTFHVAARYRVASFLAVHGLVGRGFRAPNANDLGAVGLNDLGYEVPSADAVGAGALLSTNAGEGALSAGRRLGSLAAESLLNYEVGLEWRGPKWVVRTQGFWNELSDPIVRRTLLFPAGSVPAAIGGIPVRVIPPTPQQLGQGVVTVATSLDPRAVKSFVNDGKARYYGGEAVGQVQLGGGWSLDGQYTYIYGRELNPNRNIRRLPPMMGSGMVRYQNRKFLAEVGMVGHGSQDRLSGGDRDDERIGASRSRSDIASFFNGSRISPYIAGGRFTPTGETLLQIQDRVLPRSVALTDGTRVVLYPATRGWATMQARWMMPLGENWTLHAVGTNLLDRNYRVHGSGTDAPGVSAYLGVTVRF
jgi:outer membrane receptor protein involved in Fe transport